MSDPGMKTPTLLSARNVGTVLIAGLLMACDTKKVDVKRSQVPPAVITNPVVVAVPAPVVVTNPPSAPPKTARTSPLVISPAMLEIVKLAQAGVGESVMLSYIANSPMSYRPTSDEIVYLTDLGVSENVITALMQGGNSLQDQAKQLVQTPPPSAGQPPVPPAAAPTGSAPQAPPQSLVGLSATNPPVAGPTGTAADPSGQPPQQQYIVAQPVAQPAPAAPPTQTVIVQPAAPAQNVTYVVQPPPATSYTYFYETLSPYGTWIDYPGYGYCWQPTVAVTTVDWRPYSHRGRWLYTDCGWYWQSDYSWGWAPFHYGRWVHTTNVGWLWTPDTVWGPAWVTWRHSRDHCGWAPLPPGSIYSVGVGFSFHGSRVSADFAFGLRDHHYTFIPTGRLVDRNPWNHREHDTRRSAIYRDSTVVNNYIVGNNNTIINGGIERDRIVRHTRQEIRKVPIQDVHRPLGDSVRPDRMNNDGTALGVYRPKLPDQAAKPPSNIPVRSVNEVARINSTAQRSEPPKTGGGGVARPSTGGPNRGGVASFGPSTDPGASASPGLIPPRSGPAPSAARPTLAPASIANRPQTSTPVPAQARTSEISKTGLTTGAAVEPHRSQPSAVSTAVAPRSPGATRPFQNATQAPSQSVAPLTPAPANPIPATPGQGFRPAANVSVAPRPSVAAPSTLTPVPNRTGFRQDYPKIEAPQASSAVAPKFQNQGNTYVAPSVSRQNYSAPAANPSIGAPATQGFRGPQPAQPSPGSIPQVQRPIPSAPPQSAPAYRPPAAARPQQAPGASPENPGARRGGGRYEPN